MSASAPTLAHARRRRLRRRWTDGLGWTVSAAAFLLLGAATVSIFWAIAARGVHALNWSMLTQVTQGAGGGLLNAIEGTLLLALGGLVLAVPPGVAAGIFLAEFGASRFAPLLRFMSDVLVGVPSIVVGYFVYILAVLDLGWGFSALAAAIALAIICLPYITRTSEMAFRQVPPEMRDAARALGATDSHVILGICLPTAASGVVTGILLALAISVGETAPLLYTAGWSNYMWTGQLTHEPVAYLTYAIWAFITEPFQSAHALAYAAALLVSALVLAIGIVSRLLTGASHRSPGH
ncbi:MAG: phosphate ABC transporter permease PstA [Terriglobales bacterium]